MFNFVFELKLKERKYFCGLKRAICLLVLLAQHTASIGHCVLLKHKIIVVVRVDREVVRQRTLWGLRTNSCWLKTSWVRSTNHWTTTLKLVQVISLQVFGSWTHNFRSKTLPSLSSWGLVLLHCYSTPLIPPGTILEHKLKHNLAVMWMSLW